MVSLKYLSKFWKTLKMPLINCEVNLILTWSKDRVIVYTNVANQGATFPINDTKPYVPLVTSSTQNNAKFHNYNLVLKEKLIGKNIYQNLKY